MSGGAGMSGGRDVVARLAERFATPLYLYDAARLEARAAELIGALPAACRLLYSLKANPMPAVAAVLRAAGCGAEVSSVGELEAALQAGFPPAELLLAGPGKTEHDLGRALEAGLRRVSCESWRELELLQDVAAGLATRVEVILRVDPGRPRGARLAMAGDGAWFGFDPLSLAGGAARLRAFHRLEVSGVHVYHGTQVAADALAATFDAGIRLAGELAEVLGLRWRWADLGGGFPWPYAAAGRGPDEASLRGAFEPLRRRPPAPQVWLESGRFLAASAGTLVLRVLDVRVRGGRRHVVADGGINHLGGMTGLGRLLRPRVEVASFGGGPVLGEADVVGPLCTPLDVLARGVPLPACAPGDLLTVPNAGAYGATASLVAFLGRAAPVEVVHRGGEVVAACRLRGGHEALAGARHDEEPIRHVH